MGEFNFTYGSQIYFLTYKTSLVREERVRMLPRNVCGFNYTIWFYIRETALFIKMWGWIAGGCHTVYFVESYQRFGGTSCLHLQGENFILK
jgi:hypothetical protein